MLQMSTLLSPVCRDRVFEFSVVVLRTPSDERMTSLIFRGTQDKEEGIVQQKVKWCRSVQLLAIVSSPLTDTALARGGGALWSVCVSARLCSFTPRVSQLTARDVVQFYATQHNVFVFISTQARRRRSNFDKVQEGFLWGLVWLFPLSRACLSVPNGRD